MAFKRTPTVEASLILGIAFALGLLLFSAISGWKTGIGLSQGMALVLQIPSWILMVIVGRLRKKASKYGRFSSNVSVVAIVSLGFIALIYGLASGAKGGNIQSIENTFNLVTAVFFITSLIGAVLTQFVVFRKLSN